MKQSKTKAAVIGLFITILMVLLAFLVPIFFEELKEKKIAKLNKDLQEIYTSAIVVDDLEGGLHNDSDNNGKYELLSEKSGFQVYNAPKKNKYSLQKDYKTGKITVYFGEKEIQYPSKVKPENIVGQEIKNEDLFSYDESTGKVIVTGFSSTGIEVLEAQSAIQIPETYKGRQVVEIADNAFYGKGLRGTVVIPESIEKIGRYSFANNGEKGNSESIKKPYAGTWKIEKDKWIKIN